MQESGPPQQPKKPILQPFIERPPWELRNPSYAESETSQISEPSPGSSGNNRDPFLIALGAQLKKARQAAGYTLSVAAKRCDIGLSSLKAYESGRSDPSALRLSLLAELYGVLVGTLLAQVGSAGPAQPEAASPGIAQGPVGRRLSASLEATMAQVGASSATVYVRDPHYRDEVRLALMLGVKVTAPMHGFLYPLDSADLVVQGSEGPTFEARAKAPDYPEPLRSLVAENPLFGDFGTREGVRSWARFKYLDENEEIKTIVWFNFGHEGEPSDAHKEAMQRVVDEIVEDAGKLRVELAAQDSFTSQSLMRLLDTSDRLNRAEPSLDDYLDNLLRQALLACGLSEDSALGAIFLAREGGRRLDLARKIGECDGNKERFEAACGEGIVSWVALKQRCLLIHDVETSPFESIFVKLLEGSRSALAVPLIADHEELLGVLLLESRDQAIDPSSVRWLFKAATQATLALRLLKSKGIATKTLKLAHDAATLDSATPLNDLAEQTESFLGAGGCDLWAWDSTRGKFSAHGRSHYDPDLDTEPRPDGRSRYVLNHRQEIWIEHANTRDSKPYFWRKGRWDGTLDPRLQSKGRDDLNPEVTCELGLPIILGDDCVGVAWVKYRTPNPPKPTPRQMAMAQQIVSLAGLVMGRLRVDSQRKLDSVFAEADREQRELLLPSKQLECGDLEGYALYAPQGGELGGDFYAVRQLHDHRTAFVVGDAEGHGPQGATRMLPLLTAAELSLSEAWSNRVVLGKLHHIGQRWSLRSTAVAFQIEHDMHSNRWILSSVSMGHPALLVVKKGNQGFTAAPSLPLASGPQIGHAELNPPLAEEFVELEPGDCVIAFTDGVTESFGGPNHEMFELAGVIRAVVNAPREDPRGLAEAIHDAVAKHRQPASLEDDITVLVVRIPDGSERSPTGSSMS